MKKDTTITEYRKKIAYLTKQLEQATRDLVKLDMTNLNLTLQIKKAHSAFNFINIMQKRIEKALTYGDLYSGVVKALTLDMYMDSSALLKINTARKKLTILASAGLPDHLTAPSFNNNISEREILTATHVNSSTTLQPFHKWVRDSFSFQYFVWYPFETGTEKNLVLFVGNSFEDLMFKQAFSEESLETIGAITSVIALRRDNIEKTQNMLRKKDEHINFLADILTTSPISIIATDDLRHIIYANQATEKLYGYSTNELMGNDPSIILSGQSAADKLDEIYVTISRGHVWKGELTGRHKNGDVMYIQSSFYQVMDKLENTSSYVCFTEDITDRKKQEKELFHLTTALNSSIDGILIGDSEGRIIDVNYSFLHKHGMSDKHHMIGRTVYDFIPSEDRMKVRAAFDNMRIAGFFEDIEYHILATNGTKILVEGNGVIMRDHDGKFIGFVIIVRDITEKKKVDEELKHARAELELKTKNLEETNTALKVLLKHQDEEQNKMQKSIVASMKTLVLPYLEKIKAGTTDERNKTYIGIIETNIAEITRPFTNQITEYYSKLTPTEIQIANLIRENKSTKEIARILLISETTVFFHRRNLRTKLNIKSKKINLRSYLQSIPGS